MNITQIFKFFLLSTCFISPFFSALSQTKAQEEYPYSTEAMPSEFDKNMEEMMKKMMDAGAAGASEEELMQMWMDESVEVMSEMEPVCLNKPNLIAETKEQYEKTLSGEFNAKEYYKENLIEMSKLYKISFKEDLFEKGWAVCASGIPENYHQYICSQAAQMYYLHSDQDLMKEANEMLDQSIYSAFSDKYIESCGEMDRTIYKELGMSTPKSGDLILETDAGTIFWGVRNGLPYMNSASLHHKKGPGAPKLFFAQ